MLFSGHVSAEEKLGKTQDEADCCSIGENDMQKQENVAEETFLRSVQAKVHDFDMSQLYRDFAEDFSQKSDLSKLSKVAEDPPQNNFSPSACLSAMKQAKQKASQANLHMNSDGISKRRHVSATKPNFSTSGDTISDSGFQSTVVDTTHLTTTSFVLPSSENNSQCQSAFKAGTHRAAPFLSTHKGNGNTHLDDILQETDANLCSAIKESQMVDRGTESELPKENMSTKLPSSAKGAVDNINCILQSDQVNGSLQEKTIVSVPSIHVSGFKTASNKGIQISSANLERAKCLFKENEDEKTFCDQPTKIANDTKDEISLSHGSVKNTTFSSNQLQSLSENCGSVTSQLTASQKADVTDLCTLLEEADSQFEFTQFRTAKLKLLCQDKLQRGVEELDPDSFTGIDFDDSFTSDAEKHMEITVMPEKSTSTNCETSEGFKTAQENILRVSKKCLSKARALFAGMEENLKDQKSPDKQSSEIVAKTEQGQITGITDEDATNSFKNSKMDITTCQTGFQMASGNEISVSAEDMQEVDAFFEDGNILDGNTGMSVKHKMSIKPLPGSVNHKKNLPEFKNAKEVKDELSKEPIREFENIDSGPAHNSNLMQPNVTIHSLGLKNTSALTNAISFHENWSLTAKALSSPSCTTLKDISSSAINELNNDCGFSTANGKKIFVSVDAVKKAEGLLNEIHTLGEADKQLKEKGEALRTGCLTNQIQVAPCRNGGFQTASGKGVVISSAALKKAKSLLSEFDAVEDNICGKPTHTGPPHNNHGFLAASGKPVALSAEALQKAKALFSDIGFIVDIPAVSDTNSSSKTQDKTGKTGETVRMFPKNQLKAKNILNEFKDSGNGCGEFENMHVGPVASHEIVQHHDMELNTLNSTNAVSLHGNSSLLLKPFCTASKKIVSSAFSGFSSGGGFCAASGKKVSVSDDALTEANFLLSESFAVKDTNKKLKHSEDTLPPQNGGFQTASGKGVAISSAALKKAKILLSECDGVNDEIGVKSTCSKIPVPGPQSENSGFLAASGKPMALSAGALQKAKALFSDISFSVEIPAVSDTRNSDKTQDNAEKIHCGFMTAGGATVHVSQKNQLKEKNLFKEIDGCSSGKATQANTNVDPGFGHAEFENVHVGAAVNHDSVVNPNDVEISRGAFKNTPNSTNATSLVARPLPSQVCTTSKNIGLSAFNEFSSGGGFCTASGKKVSVSDDAMTKAKCLLNESAAFESTNKKDILPPKSSGFQTASGKVVAISSAALKTAKALLNECEEVDNDKTGVKPAHSKISVSVPPPKEIHCGFTTAGGAKVHVLQQNLLKAKNLFKEFAEEDCRDSDSHSTSPHDIPMSDLAKLKYLKRTFSTNANDKYMSAKESVPQVLQSFPSLQEPDQENEDSSVHGCSFIKGKAPTNAFECEEGKITSLVEDDWHDIPAEEMASVLDYEVNQASFNQENKFKSTKESSFLIFQSLDLSDCTDTQQKFLAQEALDCTKALLEDEGLAGQNLSVTSKNVQLQSNPKYSKRSEEEQKRKGKRPAEDVDMTGKCLCCCSERTKCFSKGCTACLYVSDHSQSRLFEGHIYFSAIFETYCLIY